MQIDISYARFFEHKQHSPNVDEVVHECIARKVSLLVSLGPAGVVLSVHASRPTGTTLSLAGRWRSPLLASDYQSAGALVFAPFVFLIEQLSLPHGTLFTLGRSNRSVADFVMRNLFYAACRREKMAFHAAAAPADAETSKGSRDLARTYLWIAKANLKDKVFSRGNAPELILACAHLPLFEFSSALMEAGAAEVRHMAARNEGQCPQREQKRAFMQLRERVLDFYRT